MATIYICKCGRRVSKSTNADNTGNRDTENCKGCPYLLPWGPFEHVPGQGFVRNVQGYECRMSKGIEYATRFCGSVVDKCSCYIASLDFDFLTRVSNWIKETYPGGELNGSFFTDDIRAYVSNGRYRMSISCAQNKKGIAAKAALLHQFFDASGARLDMTPEEEKNHILAAIEAGKAKAQKKEDKTLMYKDPVTGWLYRVGPNPINDKGVYELEYLDQQNSTIWKPDVYWNTNAVYRDQEHLQKALDDRARRDGWELVEDVPAENPTPAAPVSPVDAGAATQSPSDAAPASLEVESELDVAMKGHSSEECQECGISSDKCRCKECLREGCRDYPGTAYCVIGNNVCPGRVMKETSIPGADGSTAFDYSGLGDGTNVLTGSCELRAFDFSELGEQLAEQAAEADKQFNLHYGKAQDEYLVSCIYLARIHELTAKAGRYGGGTWTAWYQSKGISEGSARTMVQNGDGFKSASVADLKNLPVLTKKDLNLIARNGVANQVVEAAGEGDSDRIQDILNQLKAVQTERDEARKAKEKAEQERDAARDAQANLSAMANKFSKQRDAVEQRVEDAEHRAEEAERRARAAEEDAAGWKQAGLEMQELVDQRDERIRELESGITVETTAADQEEIERRANELSEPLVKIINQQNAQIERMASGNTVSAQASVLEQYLRTMQTSLLGNARRAELACYDVGALDSLARALREFADEIDGIFEDRSEDND